MEELNLPRSDGRYFQQMARYGKGVLLMALIQLGTVDKVEAFVNEV
jgi:hypothetical protein